MRPEARSATPDGPSGMSNTSLSWHAEQSRSSINSVVCHEQYNLSHPPPRHNYKRKKEISNSTSTPSGFSASKKWKAQRRPWDADALQHSGMASANEHRKNKITYKDPQEVVPLSPTSLLREIVSKALDRIDKAKEKKRKEMEQFELSEAILMQVKQNMVAPPNVRLDIANFKTLREEQHKPYVVPALPEFFTDLENNVPAQQGLADFFNLETEKKFVPGDINAVGNGESSPIPENPLSLFNVEGVPGTVNGVEYFNNGNSAEDLIAS